LERRHPRDEGEDEMKFLLRLLCFFGKHQFILKQPLNIKADYPLLSVEGYADYKCLGCCKESHGYFYSDGFRTLSWHRLLTEEEKGILTQDPYCFIKKSKMRDNIENEKGVRDEI
jgi:hypothetical protein